MSQSLPPELSADVHKQLLAGFDIFHPSRLSTEDDIAVAVNVLEGSLDSKSMGPIILCSLQPEHPYVFEFIVSSISEDSVKLVLQFILEKIPSNTDGFRDSLGHHILSRLSHSLSRLPYPSGQPPDNFDDHRRDSEAAPALLDDLFKLSREGYLDGAEAEGKSNKKNAQRGKTQRSKVMSVAHAEINDRLFRALGRDAPKNRESTEELVQSIVTGQKNTLKFFTALMRTPDTARLVRSAYFRENVLQGNLPISDEQATPSSVMGLSSSSIATTSDLIQADLYFESAANYGKWRILCSGLCLSNLARDGAQSDPVLKRLEELSSGCFSETNQMRLTKDSPIEIYRARLPGSVRLVYHIDVIHEFGKDFETQVLRVLGIYSMDELNRTDWDKLGKYRARKGPDYIAKCRARKCSRGFYFDPVTFDATVTSTEAVFAGAESPEKDEDDVEGVDEIHRLLDLEQYAILSQNIISDILEGNDYPRVFQISREEKKVVECTRSSFVLGRSGTGKTTAIVFKIFGIERAWQNQGCVGPRPRQLFITMSRLLAEKVERDYVSLLYSLSTGPDAPLYVRERIQRWNTRKKKVTPNPSDKEGKRGDLPNKFSELCDSDFPLFLTMETLSRLLEADIKPASGSSRSRDSRSIKKTQGWSGRNDLVTYDDFKRMYWPHLPRSLTKGVSSSLAFSEFLGTIKGSEKSLDYPTRALDREAYENLRNTHKVDYSLFEGYQNLKLKRGERDLADRTHILLNDLKENGLKGELIDFAYVDEVQDLLLIDTRLIISLCRNPDGLVWAGDTAQTISIGSTFTFKQLGASVWRYQRSIRALRGTPRQPEGFQLLKNYRSHGGIVECANAVIQLLQRFPGAIDLLRPEAAVVGKELPKFFHGEDFAQGRDFFLSTSGHLTKLGHNQCIIVRDNVAHESFQSEIGRVGLTLTLFNSKGLEYDDVILYNFFEESAPEKFWQFLVDANQNKLLDSRYAPLIHELKCFYVAITRARHRLWIVDYSEKCEPIMRSLLDRGLVIEPPVDRNPLESFANKSSSDEWSEEGNRLLNHRVYEEAILAFDNAGDVYMRAVAAAYQSQEVARDVPESQTRRRREAFMNAASAFEYCAENTKSAEELSDHYGAAARCYAEIKYHQDAVRAFKLASMFTEAASYCFDHNLLDTAVSIIKKYEAEVNSQTKDCIREVARLSYLESKQIKKAAALFKDDEEEMMEFIVEHDLGATRAVILMGQGKYGEAVRQYLDEEQDLEEALDLTLEHVDDVMGDGDAFSAIVEKFFWRNLSFGCRGWPEHAEIPSGKILALLERTRGLKMNDSDQKTLFIFKLILHDMKSKTTQRILSNHIIRSESLKDNKAIRLLALDHLFDDMSSALDISSQTETISSLELFYEYSRLIRDAALDKAPWDSPWLTTLFQIEKNGEGIQIRPETALYEYHKAREPSPGQSTDLQEPSAVSLSREEFTHNLGMLLSDRLRSRIAAKARILLHLRLFDPCIQLVLHGTCRDDHSVSHQLDEEWFNRRARFHLLHIMILENLYASDPLVTFRDRIWSQRNMLNVLGNALNPLLHLSGSVSILNEDLIPEAADGFSTVKRWAFDVLYALDPSRLNLQGAFLTNLSTAFTLGRLIQDGRTVDEYLHRIPSTSLRDQPHPRLIFKLPSGSPIYTLHDFLGFIDGTGDLARGIRFFRHLVRERIPIDLAVLCNIMERLFGLAIMTEKCKSYLHDVLLPQTWILALWKDFVTFKGRALAPLYVLAQWTETLLRDVYTGKYLRDTIRGFDRPSVLDQQYKVENFSKDLPREYLQDLCIARICRCLSLLGENFPDLRSDVVRTMGSFRTAKRPEATAFHWRYTSSQNWPNIAKALYQSTPQPFDQLVKLRRRIFPLPVPCPQSVKLVVFDNMNTIPELLQSRSTSHQGHRRHGVDFGTASQANFGPSSTMIVGHTSDTHEADNLSDMPSGNRLAEGLAEYTAQDADNSEETDRTKEVIIIQRAVRSHLLKDIEEDSSNVLTKGRDRLFKSCKASADAVHPKYRKIYLGPVPHLLLCVEWIVFRAQESKSAIKARRVKATLQEKSDLMVQHKLIRVILYEAGNLQNRIEPGSNVHPGVDLDGGWDGKRHLEPIRIAVAEARDLLERLEDPEAPTNEFEIAWNGIMPSRLRERKRRR